MSTGDDLRSQIFALSASERADLVRLLLLSLEGESFDDEVQQAWVVESERRSDAYRQGESQSRDWREAIHEMQEELKRRRPTCSSGFCLTRRTRRVQLRFGTTSN